MRNQLTKRQFEIVEMTVWTGRYKSTAVNLGISPKTVENTLHAVCDKLGCDPSELTALYMEQELGAVRPPQCVIYSQVSLARQLRGICSSIIVLAVLGAQFVDGFTAQRTFRTPQRTAQRVARLRRAEVECLDYLAYV